jgi:hypothetical protein
VYLLLSQTSKNVIFFLFSIFFYKISEQESGTGPAEGWIGTSRKGEVAGKRGRG